MRNTTVVRWFFGCCILPTKPSCARFECHFLGEECRVVLLVFSPHYLAGGRLPCLHRKTPTPRFKSVLCIYIYIIYIYIYIYHIYIYHIYIYHIYIYHIYIYHIYIYHISFQAIFPVPNSCLQQSSKAPLRLPVEGLADEELFGLPAKEKGLGGFGDLGMHCN